MCVLVKMYIDFVYQELGKESAEQLLSIPPGLKVLKNCSQNLFEHPHVKLWHRFLLDYFDPRYCGRKYSIILPCSSVKPYRMSATHRIVDSTLSKTGLSKDVQVYVLSEPMIVVPRELDIYYPFANYDYPVKELKPVYRDRFVELLSIIIPKLAYHSKIVAVLPKHHLSILLDSIERSGVNLNVDIIHYGRRAFQSVKLAVTTIHRYANSA